MTKVEVNLKLFVTCRLCLDETGHYQIDSRVQEQIKYCFDFDVDPFDSLPKLICKKCEEVLTNFNEIKKKVQEKQHLLNLKLKSDNVVSTSFQQQDIVSSTQSAASETEETSKSKSLKLLLKKSPSTSDSTPHENKTFVITNPHKVNSPQQGWRRDYNKLFACRFCSNVYKHKRSLVAHLEKHKECLEKFSPLLKDCKISIPKIDEQPNITGMKNMVMIEEGKIIQNSNHQYIVHYKHKTIKTHHKEKDSADSSDEDIIDRRNRKRLRLMSQSSEESIILGIANKSDSKNDTEITSSSKNKFNNSTIECVDIDSSSESDSGNPVTKLTSEYSSNKTKVVNHIVTSCYNKFIRKDHPPANYDNSKESQLQHKILSIGQKVINKFGFNCTGILRYMESKNLNIKWNPKIGKNMDSDYVRIRTKLLENKKDDSYVGWKCYNDIEKDADNESYNDLLETMLTRSEAFEIVDNLTNGLSSDQAQCILTSVEPSIQLRKILNQNPVANPKQLPKKLISPDCTSSAKLVSVSDNTENKDENFHMPVITNTVSLANFGEQNNGDGENKLADNTSKEVETTPAFVPKIKVKPVSQLMPDKTTNPPGATVQTGTWNIPVNVNNPPPPEYGNTSKQNEWVLMHTVELPNTVTASPFKYFQSLLQMHNIVLLDTKATISSHFSCLIKFKSVFKQESKRITLCLSLYSDIKQFYIQVTDTSSSIDIMTLTPTWQWEILQLYRSDIVNNVLENAKKISQKMYEATKYFMSILRSIVFSRQNER